MMRYKKYKRGTPLEITEKFKNGESQKTIGYYWMNDATNRRIILLGTNPPMKLGNRFIEKRYCYFDMITEIKMIV